MIDEQNWLEYGKGNPYPSSFPTFRDHRIIEIALNLTEPLRFLPLAPFYGRGGRGVRGGVVTCAPPVQLFVHKYEGRLGIEFTIENLIKTQCKTPHPQPLSPKKAKKGRGEQAQRCG